LKSHIRNVEKVENCIINQRSQLENKIINDFEENDLNDQINYYMVSKEYQISFFHFFVKVEANQ